MYENDSPDITRGSSEVKILYFYFIFIIFLVPYSEINTRINTGYTHTHDKTAQTRAPTPSLAPHTTRPSHSQPAYTPRWIRADSTRSSIAVPYLAASTVNCSPLVLDGTRIRRDPPILTLFTGITRRTHPRVTSLVRVAAVLQYVRIVIGRP